MTEPVARTAVRRTVRVAVALIAGQAVLCAVIGWVTFGTTHTHHPGPPPAAEPLAGPPLVVPPAVVPPPRAPGESSIRPAVSTATAKPAVTTRPRSVRSSAPQAPRRTAPPAPSPPAPPATNVTPLPAAPTTLLSPTDQPQIAPPIPTTVDVQLAVVIGDQCNPESAPGVTADDIPVQCVRQTDGSLRWQIN